ncbi:hypothetical protein AC579_8997 [Pseudocercospora musae]|uniref:hydroxymethylglutaryl-CoA lyase n=1 Tax=Pseudocercospora musae TaxID=113226 RepID=A0A139I811_9PEZI|nr:hypothetical protein AC579_8997 [Pseudocercospora musae]
MKSQCVWLFACISSAFGAVSVVRTNQPPTGYEVTFTYNNSSAQNVHIAGIPHFTNQYQTTVTSAASFDPIDYRPGDFPAFTSNVSVYSMDMQGDGVFTFTGPLPSGTYQYYFLADCQNVSQCVSLGQGVTDPDNPPFETVQGTEAGSPFQVPFDSVYQSYADLNLNFDYALPVEGPRGKVITDFYPSPGAVSPSPGTNNFAVYLPPGYDNTSTRAAYPLLYLSHGGGGAAGDWQNQGQVSNILDRLILEGHIESTVVVMPTFNGLLNTSNPSAQVVRPLYQQNLFPYIESHYHVSKNPDRRAFAGLSLGSALTYEMYINATSYFGYFGLFSGAMLPGHPLSDYVNSSMAAENPALLDRGLAVAYGLFDIAFDDTRLLQEALDGIGLKYVSRVAPFGFHAWNTWQDALWTFGRTTLWKPRPLTEKAGHGHRTIKQISTRNFSNTTRTLADHVRIIEVGPRDGLQNEKGAIPPETKIELVNRLARTGLQTIEAGSFVHPKWVPQMAASDQVLSSLLSNPPPGNITYQWLLPNMKGLDNYIKVMTTSTTSTSTSSHQVSIFTSATETFSQKNTNRSIQESLDLFAPLIQKATENSYPVRAYISVALGCPYEGPNINPHHVADLAASLLELGAQEISIADTTGTGTAPRTRTLLKTLQQAGVKMEDVAMHFHDTFGQALINTMVSLEQGVRKFDSAVGGLGGCPYSPGATGNVATEDLVYCLESLGADTGGVDLEELSKVGEWITGELGKENASSAGKGILARLKGRERD